MDANKNYGTPRYSVSRGWIEKKKYEGHCAGCGQFFTSALPYAKYHDEMCQIRAWRKAHPGYWRSYEAKRKIKLAKEKAKKRRRELSNIER